MLIYALNTRENNPLGSKRDYFPKICVFTEEVKLDKRI